MRSTIAAALGAALLAPSCSTSPRPEDPARQRAAEAAYGLAEDSSATAAMLDAATTEMLERALETSVAVLAIHARNLADAGRPGAWRRVPLLRGATVDDGGAGVLTVGGSRLAATCGLLRPTHRGLDLAIDGDGLFAILCADGSLGYSRGGSLQLDARRRLITPEGHALLPEVVVPADCAEVFLGADGRVWASHRRHRDRPLPIAQLLLHRFAAPEALADGPDGALLATPAAGPPVVAPPGTPGFGVVRAGMLEQNAIDVVFERAAIDVIDARRSRLLAALR